MTGVQECLMKVVVRATFGVEWPPDRAGSPDDPPIIPGLGMNGVEAASKGILHLSR